MVLQLPTSPFAARTTSSKLSGSSSGSPSSPSSTASASSSFARFSFFSNRTTGHQHNLNKHPTKVHQGVLSSTGSTTSINAMASAPGTANAASKKTDRQYKIERQSKDLWARTLFRLVGFFSGLFTLLIVPIFRAPGYSNGFGRGTQVRGSDDYKKKLA